MFPIPVSPEPAPPAARISPGEPGARPFGRGPGAVRWWMRIAGALLFLAVLGAVDPAESEGRDEARQYALKATFLYKFTGFVTWPEEVFEKRDSPFVIAVIGEDPFGEVLDKIVRDKRVDGHPIAVRRYADLEALEACQILFVADGLDEPEPSRDEELVEPLVERICQAAEECSALTVSDISDFARRGGVLRFFLDKKRVRFEINIDAGERAGLKFDSRLLELAEVVRDEERRRR